MEKTQKEQGNDSFKAKNFSKAIGHYTEAIKEQPTDHTIFGNRSNAYINLQKYDKALEDAD